MTAFLKIDTCQACQRALPWEWIPAVVLNGKPLSGTNVWRSQLTDGVCPCCVATAELARQKEERVRTMRTELVDLLGGEKPYREFAFERYQITPGNQLAYERSKNFNPATDNLYLWGACGVGKTHLAYAGVRRCFEESLPVTILWASQLSRKVRMKEPEQQQATLDQWGRAEALVIDDLGAGGDTAFQRQILQEILDTRDFHDRAGLIVTSRYSLAALAEKQNDDTIPSRLAGMCRVVEIKGTDHRLDFREKHA